MVSVGGVSEALQLATSRATPAGAPAKTFIEPIVPPLAVDGAQVAGGPRDAARLIKKGLSPDVRLAVHAPRDQLAFELGDHGSVADQVEGGGPQPGQVTENGG